MLTVECGIDKEIHNLTGAELLSGWACTRFGADSRLLMIPGGYSMCANRKLTGHKLITGRNIATNNSRKISSTNMTFKRGAYPFVTKTN
jgi:hypothetical protein